MPKQPLHFTNNFTPNTSSFGTIVALFLSVLILNGCDTSGSVGSDVISGGESTETIEMDIGSYELLSENTFSGRLPNTSVGYVEDPVYGTIRSVGLIKPGISKSQVDTLTNEDKLSLNLVFDSTIYGDEEGNSSFEVYEAGEIWRGTQLKYNSSVSVDLGSRVGEFQVAADDTTASVELSEMWKQKFMEFHNSTAADRDSTYRTTFPGLAIVPSDGNQQIRYIKNLPDDPNDEEEEITRFVVEKPDSGESSDDEDEEDDGILNLSVRDWGASLTSSNTPDNTGSSSIVMNNINHVLRLDPDIDREELASKNIVSAQLLLQKNTDPEQNAPGISRPVVNGVRVHEFAEQPENIMSEIFTTSSTYSAVIDEDEDIFRINVTQYILNEVFGENEGEEQKLYLSIQTVNGILYATHFFDESGETTKPRIVITTVK